jgi:hypothetical protein
MNKTNPIMHRLQHLIHGSAAVSATAVVSTRKRPCSMQEGAAAAQPIPIAGAEDDQILEQVSTSTTFFTNSHGKRQFRCLDKYLFPASSASNESFITCICTPWTVIVCGSLQYGDRLYRSWTSTTSTWCCRTVLQASQHNSTTAAFLQPHMQRQQQLVAPAQHSRWVRSQVLFTTASGEGCSPLRTTATMQHG